MIVFGTDGWRGEIARDFTFDNIQLVALATARYINKNVSENPSCVIGYDTRFLSKEFAQETAQVLAWQGITVHLSDTFSTTPEVSFHTKQKNASLGVVITASHNPPNYNGYKIKSNHGGPSAPEEIAKLEAELKKIVSRPPKFIFKTLEQYINLQKIKLFDAKEPYLRAIKKKLDLDAINKTGFKILYDPMHGAGINHLKDILPDIDELHNYYNPSFGNLKHPEPIQENLTDLVTLMKTNKYDIGLATDGDADRLGLVDNEGNFVDSHRVFMILLKYLFENLKKRGCVVKTVSLTSMINTYCEAKKIELIETPVGFKYISKLMVEKKVLIGGEESGGLGTILHIPERDGIFNALLILEVMAKRKMSLNQLCDELDKEFGIHRYMRRDVRVTLQQKKQILDACLKTPKMLGKYPVIKSDNKDGYKFFVENGWLLIRASGTEPLLRFYSEADSLSKVDELLDEGMKLK